MGIHLSDAAAVAAALTAAVSVHAQEPPRPSPAAAPDARIVAEHQRLRAEQLRRMEAHQRAARAKAPPERPDPPVAGVVLLRIDMSRPNPLRKAAAPGSGPPVPRRPSRTPRAAFAAALPPPPPCPNALPWPGPLPPMKTASILKAFPDLAWHICVTDMGPKGLWVGPVQLLRHPSDGWRPILYQAGLAEIFVPYHLRPAARYYDMGGPATRALSPISLQDVGPNGSRVTLTNEAFPTVAYEVRDRGIGWLCKGDTDVIRRAQELVLWAVSDAGNYDNIIEYAFRDDGSITFRTGNTGYNSPADAANPASDRETHSHDSLWYVDMDLNGFPADTASMLTHTEPDPLDPNLAVDDPVPITSEGARLFQPPTRIESLIVEDAATQFMFYQKWGYEFSPLQGLPLRHFGWQQETWTLSDIYVTRYSYADTLWASPTYNHKSPDVYLLPALDNQPTVNQDLVQWIKTAVHHEPTTEDRGASPWVGDLPGITLTHWSGFQMQPHNLFPANPLGEPMRCGS